jgi:hypothetical protein
MSSDENKIQNLNDAKFKKYIDGADFDKLMNLRSLMMRQSVIVRKESYDYVLDRLKIICPLIAGLRLYLQKLGCEPPLP